MAYTIVKSDGTILTTIADGTINTTSTSLGLPGKNYAGYGQPMDTNMVHQLESYANTSPPANPLRGQLWYNISDSVLYVCPADGETNGSNWSAISLTAAGNVTTFGNIAITGNVTSNNITAVNNSNANAVTSGYLTVTTSANIASANITNGNITNLRTGNITTGGNTIPGTITGTWSVYGTGGTNGDALIFQTGGINIPNTGGANLYGIKCDKYMYANGVPISFTGTYGNSNVATFLPTYGGNILANIVSLTTLTTGSSVTPGTMTGNFTLSAGSRLNATYADLAERFEADTVYDSGTVVELGGEKEITAVKYELSEDVFGVISDSAAYLMNSGAGSDSTHPPVAVSGRVPVKVVGKVKKGDRLVSAGSGIARAAKPGEATAFNTIGRALADKDTTGEGTVEAVVVIR
jgi:3-keto-L-gulonate-6-phosphate decarboxylase